LKSAKLGFYDQEKHEYLEETLAAPHEIACSIGNISLKENKPFIHMHAVLTSQQGNTHGGHLLEGKVFAAEIHLIELTGAKIIRNNDDITGLALWETQFC
jgi:predicted DNA-binding protein with PD1-like motif